MVTVFISYARESHAHLAKVQAFADRLRDLGLRVLFDEYEPNPPEGWPRWMEKCVRSADYVLLICTETYSKRIALKEARGVGAGVRLEGELVYNLSYVTQGGLGKLVPILLSV